MNPIDFDELLNQAYQDRTTETTEEFETDLIKRGFQACVDLVEKFTDDVCQNGTGKDRSDYYSERKECIGSVALMCWDDPTFTFGSEYGYKMLMHRLQKVSK